METEKSALIIGAGPAGLTAAYELLTRTRIKPIILESSDAIGGISKTVNYKGNRIDIGGHRFFSKSKRVMQWWQNVLPTQGSPSYDEIALRLETQQKYARYQGGPNPEVVDAVMLLRNRVSRIFFLRKFFDYPISLSVRTVLNLGLFRMAKIGVTYMWAVAFPIQKVRSLQDFFINRFGSELYNTFFKDYTEKVWGVPCDKIKPEWGAQRIKGLSIVKTLVHAVKQLFKGQSKSIDDKTETSLIEQFMYPKLGPGQLWEKVAQDILRLGGEIRMNTQVTAVLENDGNLVGLEVQTPAGTQTLKGDYIFSSMPVQDLLLNWKGAPKTIPREVARGLIYRDFITVGLLVKELKIKNETEIKTLNDLVPDNWIYIQERDVKIGRLQIFNNWSPYLVADKSNVWLGLEYFCNEGDPIWSMKDQDLIEFAKSELHKIDIIDSRNVMDATVLRTPKAYPAYFGSYDDFPKIIEFTNRYENLFLVGRNGMHRYNNSDHSMLTAMVAVDNILEGRKDKSNIWAVNTEEDYHETNESESQKAAPKDLPRPPSNVKTPSPPMQPPA